MSIFQGLRSPVFNKSLFVFGRYVHLPILCPDRSAHLSVRCLANVPLKSESINEEITSEKTKQIRQSFIKNLFVGKFDVEFLTFPEALDVDQLKTLDDKVTPIEQYFSKEVDSKLIDASANIPEDTIKNLRTFGLFGQQIPTHYGGSGLKVTEYARLSEVTALDGSISVMLTAHQSMGAKGILLTGTEKQKQYYLPRLATGEWIAAFCLSEQNCGSDASLVQTRAKLSEDGNTWLLNGSKIWVSNGGLANLFTVIAQTEVEDNLGQKHDELTAFLVERGFGGVTSGEGEDKLGVRGLNTCQVNFVNTPVPVENVLGEVGDGFKIAMNILHSDRYIMGSTAAGVLKELMEVATEHVINRKQFGKHLKDFDLVQGKLSKITCLIYAIESVTYLTAGMLDKYELTDSYLEAAIVKVFSSENLWQCVGEFQQIFGGISFMKEYPYERILRDSRFSFIFNGTNDVLRMFIAMAGLQHAGSILQELVRKLRNPLKNPGLIFSKTLERRFHAKDAPKLTLKLDDYVHPSLQNSAKQLEYCVLRLEYAVEMVLSKYGEEVVQSQMDLNRLADIVISIYTMTAVLARSSRSYCIGLQDSDYEVLVAMSFCKDAYENVKANVKDIENSPYSTNDMHYRKIAKKTFNRRGYFPIHPLARNF